MKQCKKCQKDISDDNYYKFQKRCLKCYDELINKIFPLWILFGFCWITIALIDIYYFDDITWGILHNLLGVGCFIVGFIHLSKNRNYKMDADNSG